MSAEKIGRSRESVAFYFIKYLSRCGAGESEEKRC